MFCGKVCIWSQTDQPPPPSITATADPWQIFDCSDSEVRALPLTLLPEPCCSRRHPGVLEKILEMSCRSVAWHGTARSRSLQPAMAPRPLCGEAPRHRPLIEWQLLQHFSIWQSAGFGGIRVFCDWRLMVLCFGTGEALQRNTWAMVQGYEGRREGGGRAGRARRA